MPQRASFTDKGKGGYGVYSFVVGFSPFGTICRVTYYPDGPNTLALVPTEQRKENENLPDWGKVVSLS